MAYECFLQIKDGWTGDKVDIEATGTEAITAVIIFDEQPSTCVAYAKRKYQFCSLQEKLYKNYF